MKTPRSIHDFQPIWPGWQIGEPLGSGSIGSVYHAHRDDPFGKFTQEAAVKHISIPGSVIQQNRDGLSDKQLREHYRALLSRIVREIHVMFELRGKPNFVCLNDYAIIPKAEGYGYDVFLRMELLTSMRLWVRDHEKEIGRDRMLKLGVDIARALMALHDRGRCCIYPSTSNILVDTDGSFKLGDIILESYAVGEEQADIGLGVNNHLPPEVYLGNAKPSAAADVYALGMMMYRWMNRGFLPFTDEEHLNSVQALHRRLRGEALPPPRCADKRFAQIILKCCAPDPADRYHTAAELYDELMAYQYELWRLFGRSLV